ncbi:hypothetical protein FXF51_58380 [Nonomuraea sp. PA05]|uniref:hypothetical protein n=1 Tax=Nonomuraea sp. PA05 TaxID=2604466 RepID=UPI0011D9B7EE|nr:hypothetical protein [Nonomuraea sp. PA05]TYB47326.1 hypothetical protein FXF51_58380 [Nonomuraea sp. PA05]
MAFRKLRHAAAAFLVAAGVIVLAAAPAGAADGSGLRPGDVVCTDRAYSDRGAWAYGNATHQAPVTWTIRTSATVDGPETELLRRTQWELTSARVTSPSPGPAYYRACLTNTSDTTVHYRLSLGPVPGPKVLTGVGPHTAVLGAGARACGEWAAGWEAPALRLAGTSSVPVLFAIRAANGDGEILGEQPLETTASIDRALTPPITESYEVCVTNTSPSTATLSWEVKRA